MIEIKGLLGIPRRLVVISPPGVALAVYATSLNAQLLDATLWVPHGPVSAIAQSADAIIIGGTCWCAEVLAEQRAGRFRRTRAEALGFSTVSQQPESQPQRAGDR